MTFENFKKQCETYLKDKGCEIKEFNTYLANGLAMVRECEFEYQGKLYRLKLDRYNRWTIYEHEPYPVEMKHYERILQGNEVWSKPYKDIAESLNGFFNK